MRRKICLLLCAMMICILFTAQANSVSAEDKLPLSQMTEEECLSFIKENGVMLPDVRENESDWGPFVKNIITLVESDPDISFGISYTVAAELAEEIRNVVIMYHGIDLQNISSSQLYNLPTLDGGMLEDSEIYSAWDDDFLTYNCYMYAIGLQNELDFVVDPGYYAYIKGSAAVYDFDFYNGMTIQTMADFVTNDLSELGHTRIRRELSEIDTSNLCVNESIICFRLGAEDYHFMKYTSDGWLHKPSVTRILRYKQTPTNGTWWSNERVTEDAIITENLLYYTSTIMFISYDGHSWSYTPEDDSVHTIYCDICEDTITETCNLTYTCINATYHRGTCTECGYITPATECEYTYAGNGNSTHTATCGVCGGSVQSGCTLQYTPYSNTKHRVTCTVCGTFSLKSCNVKYTHRNDANLGHVHTRGCTICGNVIGTANAPCTFAYSFAGTVNGSNTHHYACTGCGYKAASYAPCLYKNGNTCFACGTSKDTTSTATIGEMDVAE